MDQSKSISLHSYVAVATKSKTANRTKHFHAYVLHVNRSSVRGIGSSLETEDWLISRRYSDFVALYMNIQAIMLERKENVQDNQKVNGEIPVLPPKTTVFHKPTHEFLCKRANSLCEWILNVIALKSNLEAPAQACIYQFLTHNMNIGYKQIIFQHMFLDKPKGMNVVCEQKSDSSVDTTELSSPCTNSFCSSEALRRYTNVSDFKLLKVIGKGSFGKVFLAEEKVITSTEQMNSDSKHSFDDILGLPRRVFSNITKTTENVKVKEVSEETQSPLFAIKVLNKKEMVRRKQVRRVKLERTCLQMVNSPFIVRLRGAFQSDDHLFLVQDYCSGGELYFRLETKRTLPLQTARLYTAECVLALEHLHGLGIVYRDLKPENIMIDGEGHIRLVDFGLAKIGVKSSVEGAKSFVGTAEYLSPEMIGRKGHGFAVDWWALGMVLYEMLSGLPPWYSEDRKLLMKGILKQPLTFKSYMDYQTRSFLGGLLERNPKHRLGSWNGAGDIKMHPFFKDINWSLAESRQLEVPYKPKLTSAVDTSCFDRSFTSLPPTIDDDKSIKVSNVANVTTKKKSKSSVTSAFSKIRMSLSLHGTGSPVKKLHHLKSPKSEGQKSIELLFDGFEF